MSGLRAAVGRWIGLQRVPRCPDHGLRLHFGLPLTRGGLLHTKDGCA